MAFSLVNYLRKTYGIGVLPAYDDPTDMNAREAAIDKLSQDHDAESTPGRTLVEAATAAAQRTALDVDSKAEVTAKAQDPANASAAAVASAEVTAAPAHWWVLVGGVLKRLTHAAWQTLTRAEVAPAIESGTATATPADTDVLPGVKADHSLLKYTWANIKAAIYLKLYDWLIALTAKTTLADDDSLWIADAVGAASKKIAASLLMRRTKMPDGATPVYSQDAWTDRDGWSTDMTFSAPSAGIARFTYSSSYTTKIIAGISGKTMLVRWRNDGLKSSRIVCDTGINTILATIGPSADWQISLVRIPMLTVSQVGFQIISGGAGNYIEIDAIWIGDYSYLTGSLSEEAARIADQLGDTAGVGVAATGTITSSGTNVSHLDAVTIAGKQYRFKDSAIEGLTTEGDVLVGANLATSLIYLRRAINTPTDYPAQCMCAAAHPLVVADYNSGLVVILTSRSTGILGNQITLAKSAATLTLSGPTLSGGIDDVGKKIITQIQNNIAASGTRPAAAMISDTVTDVGYETTVDVASGGTYTLPSGGTWRWCVYGYGATVSAAKRGSSAGGTTLTVAGANATIWVRKVA